MKTTLSFLFLLLSFYSFSQSVYIDSTYVQDGINKLEILNGGDDQCLLSAIQPDNKVLLCGLSYDNSVVTTFAFVSRYLENGDLDSSFNATGINILNSLNDCTPFSMVLQNDGKIVLGGEQFYQGKYHGIVIRFTEDGTIDSTFNNIGYSRISYSSDYYFGRTVTMQNDKIILAGYIEKSSTDSDFFATRFLSNGKIDSTFSINGLFQKDFGGTDICRGVTVQVDNKIILSGYEESSLTPNFIRLLENGSDDIAFNTNWQANSKYSYSIPYQSIILEDNKILSLGYAFTLSGKVNLYAMRLLETGEKDLSFADDGEILFNIPGEDTYGIYGVQRENGGLVIVGNSGNINTFVMGLFALGLNEDGSIDSTFQDNGIFQNFVSNDFDLLNAVHIGQDNTIIATGYYNFYDIAEIIYKPIIVQFKIEEIIDDINTLSESISLSVYPNPLNSDNLRFENFSEFDLSIQIYNSIGKLVHKNIHVNKNTTENIRLEFLTKGTYFLKAYSETTKASRTISFVKK